MTPKPDSKRFDEGALEKRAKAVQSLAAGISEAQDRIIGMESVGDGTRETFLEFATDFFQPLYDLADEAKVNHANTRPNETKISITKTRDDDLKAVTVLAYSGGYRSLFCLPDPQLLSSANHTWTRDSMPIGKATLPDEDGSGLEIEFSLLGRPGDQKFVDFAKAIYLAAEIIVNTNAPEQIDLTDATELADTA